MTKPITYTQAERIVQQTAFLEVTEYDVLGNGKLIEHRYRRQFKARPPGPRDWNSDTTAQGVKYKTRWFAFRLQRDTEGNYTPILEEWPSPDKLLGKENPDD